MAGRKRLLTLVKKRKGTLRKCRENPNQPVPPSELPKAPYCEVSARCNVLFGMVIGWLQTQGIASVVHVANITHLAMLLEKVEALYRDIAKNGNNLEVKEMKTYLGKVIYDKKKKPVMTIKLRTNPAVAQLSEALRQAQSLLAEFGLSPASLNKVSAKPKSTEAANPWASLANS